MPEQVTLSTPVQADAGASVFRVASVYLSAYNDEVRVLLAEWNGNAYVANGKTHTALWLGAQAHALIVALNKANLSTKSLEKRCLEQMAADGKLPAGTISGAPE